MLKLDPDPRRSDEVADWNKLAEPAVQAKIAGMLAFVHAYNYSKREPGTGPPHLLEGIGRKVKLLAKARSLPLGWAYAYAGAMDDPELACAVHAESLRANDEVWAAQPRPLTPHSVPSAGLLAMNVKYMAVLALAAEEKNSTFVMRNALEVYDDLAAERGPFAVAEHLLDEHGKY